MQVADPDLRTDVRRDGPGLCVRVTAKGYAHAVQIGGLPAGCEPEDNYFDLLPGESRPVHVPDPDVGHLDPAAVRVTCLNARQG